jgi:bifunctional DNA-binding transcriptional regulator/antitoxin component of YhaV-PrlF toxin-antitoxin module
MMGSFEAKTLANGTAVIPKEVLDTLGLKAGELIEFVISEKGSVSVVAKETGLRGLKGIFATPAEMVDVEEAIGEAVRLRNAIDPVKAVS